MKQIIKAAEPDALERHLFFSLLYNLHVSGKKPETEMEKLISRQPVLKNTRYKPHPC